MTTWTALTTLPDRAAAEALGEAMERLDPAPSGVGVFEIEDGSGLWEVGGYFEARPDAAGLALLEGAFGMRPFAVSRLDDRDWVAQVRRELTPVFAGRFAVFGRHDRDTIPMQKIWMEIEAAMAFGTGHHATTKGCLLALDGLVRGGACPGVVADIGCGTGVLAMAAAKVWPKARVFAGDMDGLAVAASRANAAANGVPHIGVVQAPGFRHPRLSPCRADLVLANILARPLRALAPQLAVHLAPGGTVVLSGILSRQAAGVLATYRGFGLVPRRIIEIGEWRTLVLKKGR